MTLDTLLPRLSGVRRSGDGYVALCPAHRDLNASLSIAQSDDGKLLLHCFVGCTFEAILAALGFERREVNTRPHLSITLRPPQAPVLSPPQAADVARVQREQRNREYAEVVWRKQSRPIGGSWVEPYLLSRGVKPPWPDSLRSHPGMKHMSGPYLRPAMIAGVQDVDGKLTGIHRTYLDNDKKTSLTPPKAALGPIAGGAVRLSQQIGDALVLCEGIEDGLSIVQTRGLIVWATLGTSNLQAVMLPDCVSTVTIAADNDPPGRKAAAAKRFHEQGREVRIAYPDGGAKDFTEELLNRFQIAEAAAARKS